MKRKYTILIIILLIIASCIAFGRITGNGFVNYDDSEYITGNNNIKSGFNSKSIQWAFTTFAVGNWHPVTLLSHTLDWSLFGANASGHHLINLLLHIGAVIFLFLFLYKTTRNLWASFFATAFFALHPLRVESVAWASERKDVLSMFFGMACIYAYAFYAERQKISFYLLCFILFTLGLMSKPMIVTMPFILLLLDYWPLERWQKAISASSGNRFDSVGRLIGEKIPFVCLSIALSVITILAQNKGGALSFNMPIYERLINAVISCASYLEKIFWPANLAIFYPYEYSTSLWKILIPCLILTGVTVFVLYYIKKLPFLFMGWFWYLGTLIPVIGLVKFGDQAMADRYTYLPSIGIAIGLAWTISLLLKREDIRKIILLPSAMAILAVLTILAWKQCGYWKNNTELYGHALNVTKNNYLAYNNLGFALFEEGKIKEAINQYNEALRTKPDFVLCLNNRGFAYARQGLYQLAMDDYNEALRLKPDFAPAYFNRGNSYIIMGKYQTAIEDLDNAIRLSPDHAIAYNSRAIAYLSQGNTTFGCINAQKACKLGDCKIMEVARGKGLCH